LLLCTDLPQTFNLFGTATQLGGGAFVFPSPTNAQLSIQLSGKDHEDFDHTTAIAIMH